MTEPDAAWTSGAPVAPVHPDLRRLTAAVAEGTPDAEALVVRHEDGTSSRWSYRELDTEVELRARALQAAGLGRGDSALLVTTRRAALVPTVLAMLRAGITYVPVEAAAPNAYWRTVADLSGATALIGPTSSVQRAAAVLGPGTVLVDVSEPVVDAGGPDRSTTVECDGSITAYVLFTSGSTGTPKGVVVSQANVAHRLVSYAALTAGPCRYLLHSSLSFDGAVGGMFSTLARGGCLVLVPDPVAADPSLAAAAVREERITHLEPVPSWYAALLDLAGAGDLASVRAVILGGEVLPPALAARHHRALPEARLFNDYGPTEVTVAATVFEVPRGWAGSDVPIGRPHANTSVAVLDESLVPVPPGAEGELWVGGPCVAQGYLGDPDHPAFRLLDLTGSGTGDRWYRTGDLVRWDGDGELRFGGRRDRQVKIRGQRVEPEEVEAVLGGLPGVVTAAVAVDGKDADARLVAYVAPATDSTLDQPTLVRLLAERLPRHLRPAVVIVLPTLPLTAGGKVDRKALPAPPRAGGAGEAPRDALETLVAGSFAEVLGQDVDRDTDFFTGGGQSLGATRVVARLRTALGTDVSLADLVASPTPGSLADLLRGRPAAAAEPPLRRLPRPADDVWRVPASARQQSFWYLEHIPGGLGRSNLVEVLTFPPGTDPLLLRRAVEVLVQRHASLRTGFELTADGLQQVVRPGVVADVVDLPVAADADALHATADAFGLQPFDLGRAPLLRAGVTAGPDGPVLVLVVHHTVADGWSLNLLVQETQAMVASDGDVTLPQPDVEFVDLVQWQQSRPAAREDAAVEHLTAVLERAAAGGSRTLPLDSPRTAQPDVRAGLVQRSVPAHTLDLVTALGRELGCTVYSVLAASLGALLAAASGQDEVVLGGPLSGRGDPLLDRVVGCCINTGLFGVDVSGDVSFADVVRRVAAEAVAAAPHTWLPLEVPLRPMLEGVRAEVAPVLLNLLETSGSSTAGFRRHSRPSTMAYAELDLYLEHRDGGLALDAVHSVERLHRGTVERLVDRWLTLLDAALADPDRSVRDLPLLTAAEDEALDRLEGAPGPDGQLSVLEEIRARTREDPLSLAVVDASGPWSRRELWDRAGAVAAGLEELGVDAGDTVVLALDETADAVAALLGCWRLGAVAVPVGGNQPDARVDAVAESCAAAAVLDAPAMRSFPEAAPGPDVAIGAADAAYVLYTSGSTGVPKGVVVSHGALGASTRARLVAYPHHPSTALITHDLAFDAGLGIITWYLATGGTLVMARHGERLDPQRLAQLIARHGVGQLDIVPSHYRLLLDLAGPGLLSGLRLVTLGGEACPPSLVAAHRALLPTTTLVNEYGPTESTVWALAHTCEEADETVARVPIGRPISGVVARVAGTDGRRLPPGAEGELLLAGHLLADGYLDAEELTRDRFVSHAGIRWYRTGDRARWTPAGEVDFLGRDDAQVKVRGFRIELAEVESALTRLDGVVRAAAGTVELVAGSAVLVGWVQLSPAAAGDGRHGPEELRDLMLDEVPEWLVPSLVVLVDDMPETTAGKLDRDRLPHPEDAPFTGRAPSTATELAVAAVWEDLLGRPVAVDQSFFALGGQSLLAARMVARVRTELQAELDLATVLAAPRVRDIAAAVDAQGDGAAPVVEPAAPGPAVGAPALGEVDDLLGRLDELDDDEVRVLLARLEGS